MGIHFSDDTFHFAVCACLARGLTDTTTRPTAMRVLSSFLEMTSWTPSGETSNIATITPSWPYLALIRARAVGPEELKDILWLAGINPEESNYIFGMRSRRDVETLSDDDLLLITAMEMVDFQYLEDPVQTRSLQWLSELAKARPAVMLPLCGAMRSVLEDYSSTVRTQRCWKRHIRYS